MEEKRKRNKYNMQNKVGTERNEDELYHLRRKFTKTDERNVKRKVITEKKSGLKGNQ
jgi:hypothetical protein